MIINIANFNFDGGSGGGGKTALLQEKTATIVQNGSQTIVPDEGFDGMSSVQINAAITGASSAIDFSIIGYDAELSAEVNANINNDVAYSKTLYDAWNPSKTSALNLYQKDIKLVYAPNIDTSNVTDVGYMFDACTSLTVVPLYNTASVTGMTGIFRYCSSLTSVPAFDTSNVIEMANMFNGCSGLTSVPAFDTSNVTNMDSMFYNCKSLTSVPAFDTSKVTKMNNMFNGCSGLTSVPAFDTSNVTNMDSMFYVCSGLTSVPAFDTSNVTNMYNMFNSCKSLTSVPAFDTSNVTNMSNMFSGCSILKTVPAYDTSNATNMSSMFASCLSLTTIEGISFKSYSASTMSSSYIVGYSSNKTIRKAVFKDIGYNSNAKQFNTSYITNWGVNTDEIPDARQSLIDSLITYSFDRATAGYPSCTITLSSTTKALLTSEEIAQITAKGYSIA